jgi:NAD(P)-dependent dehydrogenase (short-subunit alcohol dehydrogenase family)
MNMKKILVIGGSKGIGKAVMAKMKNTNEMINISRTNPENYTDHYSCDVLNDELPEFDRLDGLIYCPGSIKLKPFNRLSTTDFEDDFNINVLGAVKVIKHYLKALKSGNNPSVVLFSTVAVKMGMPFHASISVSKAGVEALTRSLGAEFAAQIRFNAIAPTITETNLAEHLLRSELMKEKMKERHPMKQYLQPQDVADMAEFLLSDKSSTISGQIYEMDCGIVSFKL